jgi:hypothetical protein
LIQIAASQDSLFALTVLPPKRRAFQLFRLESARGWVRFGRSLVTPGAALLSSDVRRPLDLTVAAPHRRGAVRTVWSLRAGRWQKAAPSLRLPSVGPLLSGGLVAGECTFVPVVIGGQPRWPFSVYRFCGRRWQVLPPGVLNRTRGAAQGAVFQVGAESWAAWQEHTSRRAGGFDAAVYVARFSRGRVDPPRRLWRGHSLGPGSLQVFEAFGRPWTLYLRGGADFRLDAVIRPLGART